MADRLIVTKVDDLDGETPAVETLRFGLDDTWYELDLNASNLNMVRNLIEGFTSYARRADGGRKIAAPAVPATPRAARKAPAKKAAKKEGKKAPAQRTNSNAHRARKSGKPDPVAVRTWAKDNGIEVNEKGRVPGAVTEQYLAAKAG